MTQSLPSMASLIYVNDISQPSDAQVKPFSLTIWLQAPGIRSINLRLQKYLDQIVTCCDKWRIKVIPEKTNLINFSRGKVINYAAIITMYGQLVKVTQNPLASLISRMTIARLNSINATLYKIYIQN